LGEKPFNIQITGFFLFLFLFFKFGGLDWTLRKKTAVYQILKTGFQ
jgi:hypothetical protein